ncbi:hypothetical protein [Halorubrum aidingense]|uniref:hypothetical protein n=1 Tax=Halorubrum aidingense TaxID=368623 RepID=UPI0012674CAA|nr:hypothetical protein [Halorubrum aidingense]
MTELTIMGVGLVTIAGILSGVLGPAFVILPTLPSIERLIVDQTKIDKLQNSRKELSKEGIITTNTDGFELVRETVSKNWDQTLSGESQAFRVPLIGYTNENGDEAFTQGTIVYSVWDDAADPGNSILDDHSQKIESIFIIDTWITDRINRMRQVRIQRVRGLGFAMIVFSVFSQSELFLQI